MIESYTSKAAIDRARENAARLFYAGTAPGHDLCAEFGRVVARIGKADRANRLVKAAKSPTDRFPGLTGAYFNRPAPRRKPEAVELEAESPNYTPDLTTPGTWAVVEKRPWAGEWRLRMETRPGAGVQTPDNSGDRITAMLSERGARKISESCYFMACQRGGFSTFATLTLTTEAREKLARRVVVPMFPVGKGGFPAIPAEPARAKQGRLSVQYQTNGETPAYNVAEINHQAGEVRHPESGALYTPMKMGWAWSVQKEASRFFEAANKMYTRGWQYQNDKGETVKVPGSRKCVPTRRTATTDGNAVTWLADGPYTPIRFKPEPLAYLWVAENPDRIDEETGEYLGENPHLHLMMKWRVPYRHFEAWAARLEKLWGHGFAHLEKIKDPQKAGSYVAKAAGYLSKAQGKTDQGEIRGNRYGISSRARAPGWIECERHQVGMMGWLMAEAHEAWQRKHGKKIARREYLKKKLSGGEIRTKAGKIVELLEEKRPGKRKEIGEKLEEVRREIEPLPRYSKYAALFKSEEQKDRFFRWATRKGWQPEKQCSQWLHQWRREQWRRRNGSRLNAGGKDWAQWFALADAGAVECDNDADFQDIHLQELRA